MWCDLKRKYCSSHIFFGSANLQDGLRFYPCCLLPARDCARRERRVTWVVYLCIAPVHSTRILAQPSRLCNKVSFQQAEDAKGWFTGDKQQKAPALIKGLCTRRGASYSVRILMTSFLSWVFRICARLSADLNRRLTSARNCRCGPVLFTGDSVMMKMRHFS